MKNYYIVVENRKTGNEKIIGRRQTTLYEINKQAESIWGLFDRYEKRYVRVLVQGELQQKDKPFDSDRIS